MLSRAEPSGEHALPTTLAITHHLKRTVRLCLLLTLVAVTGCSAFADGVADGRRGVELLEASDFEGAGAAFQEGIDATENETGRTREALFTDLGLAHFAQSQFAEAAQTFSEALALAETSSRRAQAAYNAGTALAHTEDLELALTRLRHALILIPEFAEARFNYELVKRRLEGSRPQNGTPPEPSAFAEELKAHADSLVNDHRYSDAADLMNQGLLQDSTVVAYSDFMQRLGEVVEIEGMDIRTNPDSSR